MAAGSTGYWSRRSRRRADSHRLIALGSFTAREQPGREAGGDQRLDHRVDMAAVLRLDHQIKLVALDRGVVKQPLVMHLDEVSAAPPDHARDAHQDSRPIL